jgi:hypothetical protein
MTAAGGIVRKILVVRVHICVAKKKYQLMM